MLEVVLTFIINIIMLVIVMSVLYTTVFGGEISYKSEGLIPLIKRMNRERKESKVKREEG